MTIEENLEKIAKIAESMEQDSLTLEESLARYEEGIRLIRECGAQIDRAEKKLQILEAQNDSISGELT